jgi:O-antigen/teichoic acid export membrane protein
LKLRHDFLWVTLGRIAAALIAIASVRIMTTLLEPKDYGIYALLMSFSGFCGLFLINPVGQHINRHTHTWWDDGTLLKKLK